MSAKHPARPPTPSPRRPARPADRPTGVGPALALAAPAPVPAPLQASLPTYALYGEPGRAQATDWLHCESIAERSQRHDWEIRPHRHAALFQILHLRQGSAQAWLDGRSQALAGPCLLWVPALVPHGFRFAPTVDGTVLTVLDQHLARLLQPVPTLARRLAQLQVLQWPPVDGLPTPQPAAMAGSTPYTPASPSALATARQVADRVAAVRVEFLATAPWRDLALDAALLALLLAIGRAVPDDSGSPTAGTARALAHVQRFRALVEAQYRQQPALATLAASMGITPTQLNRVCHQVLGHSALGVLHARLVLEAQRDLAYSTLSIKQIALGLGFGDAGYFTRFFQRHTGHTPTGWRALAAR